MHVLHYIRQLVHVPILHASADMGSMGPALAAAYVERLGRRHWDEYLALLDGYWDVVRTGLERLALDCSKVDLYQDGLPLCGRELEIVKKAAATGSKNYQLLVDLIERGATLMGTEDPRLLLKEYQDVKSALAAGPGVGRAARQSREGSHGRDTMSKRDAFIGRRIGQSLRPGRMGILFLGIMHKVESFLPIDIVTIRLALPVAGSKGKA